MDRPLDRPTVAVAAARPQSRKLIVVVSALFALAAILAAITFAKSAAPRHASLEPAPVTVASADQASTSWNLFSPSPTFTLPQATNPATHSKSASKNEPDWSALSLGVTDAQAAIAVPATGGDASSPAELTVSMSRDERARLMAAAHVSDSGPAPAGYHPLIGALVPQGSGDGICR